MKKYNAPFKMKPGRGNNPKTGYGMPSQLMSGSPLKQEDPKKQTGPKTDEGLEKDPQTGSWKPREYEKSLSEDKTYVYVKNKKGGIVDRAEKRNVKAVDALKKKLEKNQAETEFRRGRNATTQNAITKTTTNVPAERATQERMRKASYNPSTGEADVSRSHQRKSKMVQARDRNRTRM
jgi:hypothetical protein